MRAWRLLLAELHNLWLGADHVSDQPMSARIPPTPKPKAKKVKTAAHPTGGALPPTASVQDALDKLSVYLAAEETRTGVLALRIAIDQGWTFFNMGEGVGDVFADQTGVDDAGGWQYNGTTDAYELTTSSSQALTYTGSDQSFVVPDGVTAVTAKLRGAGGGGSTGGDGSAIIGTGGGGGFAQATIPVTAGESLIAVVGGAGSPGGGATYGNGGYSNVVSGSNRGGSGGGFTGLFRSSKTQGNCLLLAGGGGGAGNVGGGNTAVGGAGGGSSGGNGLLSRRRVWLWRHLWRWRQWREWRQWLGPAGRQRPGRQLPGRWRRRVLWRRRRARRGRRLRPIPPDRTPPPP